MKCSHGLPYEVRCHGCMQDALARAGVPPLQAPPVIKMTADSCVEKSDRVEVQVEQWNKK